MNVFSTCWNARRHKDGGAICDEIRELGFEAIEASHGMSLDKLPGIVKAVDEKRIRVVGVHNFCPAPIEVKGDVPDAYEFTSYRETDRTRAMRLTQETLMVAGRLGASYVVLHMGSLSVFRGHSRTRALEKMARDGRVGSREFAELKGQYIRERRKHGALYLDRARQALSQLVDMAKEYNLVLGVEGRSHFEQVPGDEEMLQLMKDFEDVPQIRYWHDFGHIQRKANLLMLDHDRYLRELQPYLYGAHVNDVRWPVRDHRVPFAGGTVDFDKLLPRYFRKSMPLTWELSSSATAEEIRVALVRWNELVDTLPE